MAGHPKKSKSKKRRRKISKNTTKKQNSSLSPKEAASESEKKEEVKLALEQDILPIYDKRTYKASDSQEEDEDESEEECSKPESSQLPVPCFKVLDDYDVPGVVVRPEGYIRFIERSEEEMDEMIEYDMDEQDFAWLELINQRRALYGFSAVSEDIFEILMDRLEKEAYFLGVLRQGRAIKEEEALCNICNNGDSQPPNSITFCDMCNLAVHQDCYGVPYIPEGQWLCRRCLHSPSVSVDCVLCPNGNGALKQTDRGHWAHIICALWVPEVHFANPVFLEPIYNIESILPGRWKLTCYICKQRNAGACIQCSKKFCNLAFHATCAQLQGLDMEPLNKTEHFTVVSRNAFCHNHSTKTANDKVLHRLDIKNRPRRKATPNVSIPTIVAERIQEISAHVMVENKSKFIKRLLSYWILKRQANFGVPFLRRYYRLDPHELLSKNFDLEKMQMRLAYWKRIRQDFERVRLLCELVRKREKKKRELIYCKAIVLEMELCPMRHHMRRLVEVIRTFDVNKIFHEPVKEEDVPGYYDFIRKPMDLATMGEKVEKFEYTTFDGFKQDFDLMINNCLVFNEKNTVYYKCAIKLKMKCEEIFQGSEKDLADMTRNPAIYYGLTPDGIKPEIKTEDEEEQKYIPPSLQVYSQRELDKNFMASDFDKELQHFIEAKVTMTRSERLTRLDELMGMVKFIKNKGLRAKRVAKLKKLIYNTKKLQKNSKRKKSNKNKTRVNDIPSTSQESTLNPTEEENEDDSLTEPFNRRCTRSLPK